MVDTELRPPRRKRASRNRFVESPFPIPIQTITKKCPGNNRWYYYFGQLSNDHVIVSRDGDMTFLYRLGFFGKGVLSRSKPQFQHACERFLQSPPEKAHGLKQEASGAEGNLKMQHLEKLQQERFRIHSLWDKEKRKEESKCIQLENESRPGPSSPPPQYEDLWLYQDSGMEANSEGEDELYTCKTEKTTDTRTQSCLDIQLSSKMIKERDTNHSADGDQISDIGSTLECNTTEENKEEEDVKHKEEEDVENKEEDVQGPTPTKLQRLEDPYQIKEFLVLTLEEAFFLSFGLGCLSIKDEEKNVMTVSQMWRTFSRLKTNFVESYAVYHYFRSKGWVVRNGVMYGTDYVLYKDGPQSYHSSYAVVVFSEITCKEQSDRRSWNWSYMTSLNRVVENVAKEVLICFVIPMKGFQTEDLSSPECLSKLKVQEMLFRRWIPEKFREKQQKNI